MPRKSKQPKKIKKNVKSVKTKDDVKNITQTVVVNIPETKKPARKRRARKTAPKEEIDVNARVSPAVVYFQAPSVNLPSPFNPPKPTPFLEEPVKLIPPTKSDTLAVLGDVVSQSEFAPTANFISETDKIKSQSSMIKPITIQKAFEDPPVFANTRFGFPMNEKLTVSDYEPLTRASSISETEMLYEPKIAKVSKPKIKSFKSMKKPELIELYRTKMGSDPDAKMTRFSLIQSIEKSYNL